MTPRWGATPHRCAQAASERSRSGLSPAVNNAAATSLRAVTKLTERVHGELRFRSVPPLLVPLLDVFDKAHPQNETEYVQELMAHRSPCDRPLPLVMEARIATARGIMGRWFRPCLANGGRSYF